MINQSQILNGVEIAEKQMQIVSKNLLELEKRGLKLTLVTVQVGESKDVVLYAKSLQNLLKKLKIGYEPRIFPEKIKESELCKEIQALNADPALTGVMVFSPLPPHLNPVTVLNSIDLLKDVEGRRVLHGFGDRVISPTACSVMALLEETGVAINGKEAVVVGHSDVVGKPVAILLMDKMATVTVCHIETKNLKIHVNESDIIVAAAGKPNLIKGEWIKPGAIVIDVGENIVNGKLTGDVEFDAAKENASFISPVPGGVGPITNVMLIKNLLTLQKLNEVRNGNH